MIVSIQPSRKTTVLQQMEAQGVKVESQCRSGFCRSCKCKLVAGVVVHNNDALVGSEDDVLPCSAYAASPVRLEV